ncbi:MAG: sarcosine oxidase subunit alpha family protein [Pseudomonadota bacterium]
MSAQPFRVGAGRSVDPARPLRFRFDGKDYDGFAGDTLASALLAHGVHHVARSFKYHRPRGILGAGSDDPAALVQLGRDPASTVPNVRATELELYDGLEAVPQNCWPSLSYDVGALNDLAARFLPAGFYYKTFMGPPGNWMTFERFVRAAAGMGRAPAGRDPDRYEHVNRHCEVLVIGGGPAGLVAARTAAASGARVVLAEETATFGGRLLAARSEGAVIEGRPAADWIASAVAELRVRPDVTLLERTCAFGYYDRNWVGLAESVQDHVAPAVRDPRLPRHRLWRVRAGTVILATGALERPLVFHGNDRPGVMLAGAVRTFLHRHGVLAGRRAVVFTNNDDAYTTAFDLVEAGADVAAVVDVRAAPNPALLDHAAGLGIEVRPASTLVATAGRRRVRSATVAPLGADGGLSGEPSDLACDLIAVSGGWSPNVALFSHSRGQLAYDPTIAAFRPARSWQAEHSVGAAAGTFSLAQALVEAASVAARATASAPPEPIDVVLPAPAVPYRVQEAWELPSALSPTRTRAFVDLQDDVTAKDLHLAVQEGYASVEHAKRYTTLGMGTDQGKTSGMNGFGIIAGALGKPMGEVGVTTYRPPYKPIPFGAVAGQHVGASFHPRRTTAMHDAHVEAGAIFEIVGDWLRPRVYPRDGEDFDAALQREARAARTDIGVLDASTLGKIDIRGPDAREFLNRVYTNAWLKLAPGRCRYGLMLNEDGMVFDDGVTACLADDHFHMTTTTGGAAGVLSWLEDYLQTEWPDLQVYLTSVTEQWAVAAICGPGSPKLVADLLDDIDPEPGAFPFMTWRAGHVSGVPVRVFRISFTGELAYEINVPARYGSWLWRLIMERGRAHGITPYGTEAMHLLRAEKGFVIVGQDTDGTVTPVDLGMEWAVKKSADFIGRRSLFRSDTARADRRQFVGLLTTEPAYVVPEGSQLIATPAEQEGRTPMIGHVTSSYFSPNLRRSIALALLDGGHGRHGETVYVARAEAAPAPALVTAPDFLGDVEGAR